MSETILTGKEGAESAVMFIGQDVEYMKNGKWVTGYLSGIDFDIERAVFEIVDGDCSGEI